MRLIKLFLLFIIIAALAAACCVCAHASEKGELFTDCKGRTMCIADRGDTLSAPENSLSAIKNALSAGADGVLIDVKRTSDGVLVLSADETLERMTGDASGMTVDSMTSEQISALRLRNGKGGSQNALTNEGVATLESVFKQIDDCLFIIDADSQLLGDIASLAVKHAKEDSVVFFIKDMNAEQIGEWKSALPFEAMTMAYFKGNVIFSAASFVSDADEVSDAVCVATKVPYGVVFGETVTSRATASRLCVFASRPELCGTIRTDSEKWWDELIADSMSVIITEHPKQLSEYISRCAEAYERLEELYEKYVTGVTLPQFSSEKYYDYRLAYSNAVNKADELLAGRSASYYELTQASFELENAYLSIIKDYDALEAGTAGVTVTPLTVFLALLAVAGVTAAEIFFYKMKKKS